MQLRPQPVVVRLTEFDESEVKKEVVSAIVDSEKDTLSEDQQQYLVEDVGKLVLVGKTPGEALVTVMDMFYQRTKDATELRLLASKVVGSTQGAPRDEAIKNLASATAEKFVKYGGLPAYQEPFRQSLVQKLEGKNPTTSGEALAILQGAIAETGSGMKAGDIPPKGVVSQQPPAVTPELGNQAGIDKTSNIVQAAGETADQAAKVGNAVASAARSAVGRFQRPPDIGCSFSILSWNETRYAFGRSVANEYIAVQVVVRNLNAKEEFPLHDSQFALDYDINGSKGRYYSGRDKSIVQLVNKVGESHTPRGIATNAMIAVGTMMSAIQPIVDLPNFTGATAGFHAGALPGFRSLLPDFQQDQLVAIGNLGFSSTSNFRTVVPKSGAATFVMFVPSKHYQEGWWVQECAQDLVRPRNAAAKNPAPQIGIDLERARELCSSQVNGETTTVVPTQLQTTTTAPVAAATTTTTTTTTTANLKWRNQAYRKWTPTSDQIFRELAMAVISGTHIQEESKNKPQVSDACNKKKTAQGDLDLSQAENGELKCDVIGENLDKVSKLQLVNASNAADRTIDGPFTTSGDSTKGTAVFQAKDLGAASGSSYIVYAVDKDGVPIPTSARVSISQQPSLTSDGTSKSVDFPTGDTPNVVTLKGFRLDKLSQVCLWKDTATSGTTFNLDGGSASQRTFKVEKGSKVPVGDTIHVSLGGCLTSPTETSVTIGVKGAATAPSSTLTFAPTTATAGASVVISGNDLKNAVKVKFNDKSVDVTPDGTKITVIVPADLSTGMASVTVLDKEGKTIATGSLTITAKPPGA